MEGRRAQFDPGIVVLVIACLITSAGHLRYINLTFDDVFISFRYAENLVQGQGLVFNPGERVEGFSNFLWTLLLAIPALLGAGESEFGMLWVAKIFGALLNLGTLVLVWLTTRVRWGRSQWAASGLGVLFLAGLAPFQCWGVVGLETPLVTFLIAGSFYSLSRELEDAHPRGNASAFWLSLAALTRPEPVVLGALFVGARLLHLGLRQPQPGKAMFRYFAAFAAPVALFLAFRFAYYGDLLPNTYYAKIGEDGRVLSRGLAYVQAAADEFFGLAIVGLAGVALALHQRISIWTVVVLAALVLQVAGTAYEGGDWMPAYRMLVPATPAVALLAAESWGAASHLELPRSWRDHASAADVRLWAGRALQLALALTLGWSAFDSDKTVRVRGLPSGFDKIDLGSFVHDESARVMKRSFAPGLIAIGEAGIVPYLTGFPTVDMFGLTDKHIAHLPGRMHAKFDVDYVLGRNPLYVYLLVKELPNGVLRPKHPHGRILLSDERFLKNYRPQLIRGDVRVYVKQ